MLSIGIIGLPNVGKSSIFNLLTDNDVLAANYPFATIEPNEGIVEIKDRRLNELAKISRSSKIIYPAVKFIDIAGLVKGASEGSGMGNKFLSNIREVDAICHTIRLFSDSEVIRSDDYISPKDDIETIETELLLSDLESIDKRIPKLQKEVKTNKNNSFIIDELVKIKESINISTIFKEVDIDTIRVLKNKEDPTEKDELLISVLNELNLFVLKPIVYLLNVDESQISNDTINSEIIEIIGENYVVVSAKLESELNSLSSQEKIEMLEEFNISENGLDRLSKKAYEILGLQSFFTTGPEETRAWTISINDTAPIAAGKIHTDFKDKFIKAEVASYTDFVSNRGWQGVKEIGKLKLEGKDYIVSDGDVIIFKHG